MVSVKEPFVVTILDTIQKVRPPLLGEGVPNMKIRHSIPVGWNSTKSNRFSLEENNKQIILSLMKLGNVLDLNFGQSLHTPVFPIVHDYPHEVLESALLLARKQSNSTHYIS